MLDHAGIYGMALLDTLSAAGFGCRLVRARNAVPAAAAVVAIVDSASADVSRLRAHVGPAAPLTAVLRDTSLHSYADALSAGADGVVGCDCSPADLVTAVGAAAFRRVLLPVNVARELAAGGITPPVLLTEQELGWLRQMHRGKSLEAVASSERQATAEVAQALHRLYSRLGVSGRTEALERLSALGLLQN